MSTNQPNEPTVLNPYDHEPEVLYTFSSLEYLDDLKAGKLWFSPTSSYNDIHENTIFVRNPVEPYDYAAGREAEILIKEWLDNQVVRCFTTDPTNTLMWAHYADSHQGICVGYRLDLLRKSRTDRLPMQDYRIRYSSTPPLSLVSGPNTRDTILHLARDILLTKSIHWAYEKEHRFYAHLPLLAEARGGLIDIGNEAVVDVIFGSKVEQKTIKEKCRNLPDGVQPRAAEYNNRALSYNLQIRNL